MYQIVVKTGDVKDAGTDANVYCIIEGANGKTQKLALEDSLNSTNKFERGCIDTFNIDAADVGKLTKLVIGHDNKGLGASWYLENVTVKNVATGDNYLFTCNKVRRIKVERVTCGSGWTKIRTTRNWNEKLTLC